MALITTSMYETLPIEDLKGLLSSLQEQLKRENKEFFLELLEYFGVFKPGSFITKENYEEYDFFLNSPERIFSESSIRFLEELGFKQANIPLDKMADIIAVKKQPIKEVPND